MVIKKKESKEGIVSNVDVDDIINRGGALTAESEVQTETDIRFTLRIPSKLIRKIDDSRKDRIGNVSRNQWILEAISKSIK